MTTEEKKLSDIIAKIERGGVFYHIRGTKITEILRNIAFTINLPESLSPEDLATSMIEREEVMTTAIGDGISLPHPRNTLISDANEERIAVCYLEEPVPLDAPDAKFVYVMFVVLSSSLGNHLQILSQLTYLFQQKEVQTVLKDKPDMETLVSVIRKVK